MHNGFLLCGGGKPTHSPCSRVADRQAAQEKASAEVFWQVARLLFDILTLGNIIAEVDSVCLTQVS